MSMKKQVTLEVVGIASEKDDQILEMLDARLDSIEAFNRSQYSFKQLISEKVSTNSNNINQILKILKQIKDQLGTNDAAAQVNLALEDDERITKASAIHGETLFSLNLN